MKNFSNILIVIFIIIVFYGCVSTEQNKINVPTIWPTVYKNENDIRKYYDDNRDKLDPIEGIYTNRESLTVDGSPVSTENPYRIAIVNRKAFSLTDEPSYEFIAIILESEYKEWTPGRIKAYIRLTAYQNMYECKWYMKEYNYEKKDFNIGKNGVVYSKTEKTKADGYGIPHHGLLETYLIRIYPLFDSRNLTNKKIDEKDTNILKGTGSGFVISKSGLIVTNYHVVIDGSKFEVAFPSKGLTRTAKIKMKDMQNDIAILEIENFTATDILNKEIPYSFADNSTVKVGQDVFTLGFPLGDIMGTTPRVASGNINSLYGLQDDPRLYQINNAIQPGNSGGALFNKKGELVGICVSGLNAKYFYENQGIIPQNMNFAIKGSYLKNLISMMPDGDEILKRINTVKQSSLEDQIEQLNPFIVQIRVY
jgi:S1-C subfamily serine protease